MKILLRLSGLVVHTVGFLLAFFYAYFMGMEGEEPTIVNILPFMIGTIIISIGDDITRKGRNK